MAAAADARACSSLRARIDRQIIVRQIAEPVLASALKRIGLGPGGVNAVPSSAVRPDQRRQRRSVCLSRKSHTPDRATASRRHWAAPALRSTSSAPPPISRAASRWSRRPAISPLARRPVRRRPVSASGAKFAPLSPIARWNNPFASGLATSTFTLHDPADSPKMVTRFGSPPNTSIFFCTHSSAAI